MKDIVERFYTDVANYIITKKVSGEPISGVEQRALSLADFASDLFRIPKIKTNFVHAAAKEGSNRGAIGETPIKQRKKRQNKIKYDDSND